MDPFTDGQTPEMGAPAGPVPNSAPMGSAAPTGAPMSGAAGGPGAADMAGDRGSQVGDTTSALAADPSATGARGAILALRDEVGKVIVGQDGALSGLIAALLVRGHVLVEGVPGVAKTLLVRTLAAALDMDFSRIQFTPDLMPADVTGQIVLDTSTNEFRFRQGPIFSNLVLADEINRTPPRTQSALLEAMQERQVTIDGVSHGLPDPFIVIATQNPIEYEGTYPLPEAQLDRFMFKLVVGYPSERAEFEVLWRHQHGLDIGDLTSAGVRPVASAADLAAARQEVAAIVVEPPVLEYISRLCRATRDLPSVELGASPRGAAALLHGAKAWAWLVGRDYLTPDEVKAVAKPVLRHRIMIRPELALDGVSADRVLDSVLATVPAPR